MTLPMFSPTLRARLLLVMLVFSALLASIQFFSMGRAYRTEALSQTLLLLRYSANSLASNLEYALAHGEERLLRHLIAQQIARPHLRYAAYLDSAGLVYASTDILSIGKAMFEWPIAPTENQLQAVFQTRQGQLFDDTAQNTLWALFPVNLPPAPGELRAPHHGLLLIGLESTHIQKAALEKAMQQALVVLLPMLLLIAVLAFLIKRVFTDRVETLLAYATDQARGRPCTLAVKGQDELGQLGQRVSALMDELRLSRDFYLQLLEKMPNPIWRSSPNGDCIHVNRAWLDFTGRTLEEEWDKGWLCGVHPDDAAHVRATYHASLEKRTAFVLEYRLRHHDGTYHSIISHGEPIIDPQGAFVGCIASAFDIEPQSRGARILAASEAKFRGLVESSLAGVYLIQHERLMYANPRLAAWLGYPSEDLTGLPLSQLIHKDDLPAVLQRLRQASPEQGRQETLRLVCADKRVLTVDVLDSLIELEHEPAMIGTMLDVSERERAYAEIQRLNAQLEQRVQERTQQLANANKELETFAYSVSHDLKAPLRGIDGYSHLLLEDHAAALNEEGLLFVKNIRAGVGQMGRLIDDLLAYSRMERRHLQRVGLDLKRAVEGILAERAGDARLARVCVRQTVPCVHVLADPDGLAQVLRNLIDNAIKYSHKNEAPEIDIHAQIEGDVCRLSVRDNGIGFDMRFADRIFDIFQRLERAEAYSGTGVGLAIVRKAIVRMGGRVWAESTPGHGACFYVELLIA